MIRSLTLLTLITAGCVTVRLEDPRTERAMAMTRARDWSAAAAMWNSIYLDSGARDLDAGVESAQALVEDGRPEAALVRLDDLARRGVDDGRIYELRGIACESLGHSSDALDAFEEAVEREPTRVVSVERLGALAIAAGQTSRGIGLLRTCLRLDSSRAGARRQLAMALVRATNFAGDPEAAAKAVDRAIERDVLTREDVREAVARFGGGVRTMGWLRWLVERDPQDARAARRLGLALDAVGNREAALHWLERAAEADPGDVDAGLAYAAALRAADRTARADAVLDHLRGLDLTRDEQAAILSAKPAEPAGD